MKSLVLLILCCSLVLLLTGCGPFERQWKQAVSAYQAGQTSSPIGPWEGTWKTVTNGHTGKLRAIVTAPENSTDDYRFRYHATFKKNLSAGYTAHFPVTRSGSTYRVDGQQKLPLYGTFRHQATITRDRFNATYSSKKGEIGSFEMKRP